MAAKPAALPQYLYRETKSGEKESLLVRTQAEFDKAIDAGWLHADEFHGLHDHGTNLVANASDGSESEESGPIPESPAKRTRKTKAN